jgi:hypothetical protein
MHAYSNALIADLGCLLPRKESNFAFVYLLLFALTCGDFSGAPGVGASLVKLQTVPP